MRDTKKYFTIIPFAAALLVIALLLFLPGDFFSQKERGFQEGRNVTPVSSGMIYEAGAEKNQSVYQDSLRPKIELDDGELSVATIMEDFDGDPSEEQIIVYRNLTQTNNPIYITYVDYDNASKTYKRGWSLPTPITQYATVSVFTEDLVGDRSKCIIITGMDGKGDRIMAVFRNTFAASGGEGSPDIKFGKIAEIKIDGAIRIVETERTQAYQLGITTGASYKIAAHGKDPASSNELDQIEITYSYNPVSGVYEQSGITRIPGAQIEAKRLRELLNGNAKEFEEFVNGLWYHVSSDGTVENSRYVYFDTMEKEVVFYDEDTQQVYNWLGSSSTRYGLYISSQNISVATLRRVIDIELESLDSIRLKVFEDVHMKILIDAPWDGIYRKATSIKRSNKATLPVVAPFVDASYSSSIGDIQFSSDGGYEVDLNGFVRKGKYVFYLLENNELLNFLPADSSENRQSYRVIRNSNGRDFSLQRVSLTTKGIQEFHEAAIIFTKDTI